MARKSQPATLPVLRAHGTSADVGRAIGTRFAERIRAVAEAAYEEVEREGVAAERLGDAVEPWLESAERWFPSLLEELHGIASGADVPLEILFHLNCYGFCPPQMSRPEHEPDGCTTVASRGERGVVVGHTEDGPPTAIDDLYVLEAEVDGHSFVALSYVTNLPGCAVAVNGHGLVVVADGLPELDYAVGVPRDFMSRGLLEMRCVDDAVERLRSIPRGGSFNCLLVRGELIVNAEVSSREVWVTEATKQVAFAHTNHFLAPALAAVSAPAARPDSFVRLARAARMVRPGMPASDVKELLSDREGYPDSICRDRTIGAAVVDAASRELNVCWGEPGTSPWTSHRV